MMTEREFLQMMAGALGGVQWLMAAHLVAVGGLAYLTSGLARLLYMWGASPVARERMGSALGITVPALLGALLAFVGLLYRVLVAYQLGTPEACAQAVELAGVTARPYCSISVGGAADYFGQGLLSLAVGGLMHASAARWRAQERKLRENRARGYTRRADDLPTGGIHERL